MVLVTGASLGVFAQRDQDPKKPPPKEPKPPVIRPGDKSPPPPPPRDDKRPNRPDYYAVLVRKAGSELS